MGNCQSRCWLVVATLAGDGFQGCSLRASPLSSGVRVWRACPKVWKTVLLDAGGTRIAHLLHAVLGLSLSVLWEEVQDSVSLKGSWQEMPSPDRIECGSLKKKKTKPVCAFECCVFHTQPSHLRWGPGALALTGHGNIWTVLRTQVKLVSRLFPT